MNPAYSIICRRMNHARYLLNKIYLLVDIIRKFDPSVSAMKRDQSDPTHKDRIKILKDDIDGCKKEYRDIQEEGLTLSN